MTLYDYLKQRGNLSFEENPFNEVDNLIICTILYTWIDEYFLEKDSYTVSELANRFFSDYSDDEIKKRKKKGPYVFKAMAYTDRFKDCLIHDFVSRINDETGEQFCAMQMDLGDGTTFVAFRGTNHTILGWRENLSLSFELIPAQISAGEYVNSRLSKDKMYRIGGHSKGGNLAVFAAISLDYTDNIIKVYSNDGPGLNKKYLSDVQKENYQKIKDKIIKYAPQIDIFGVLLTSMTNTEIIKAYGILLYQHRSTSWMVDGNHFVPGKLSEKSKMIKKYFKEYLNQTTAEERQKFIDTVYFTLKDMGIDSLTDLRDHKTYKEAKRRLKNALDDEDKKFYKGLAHALLKGYFKGLGQHIVNVITLKDSY